MSRFKKSTPCAEFESKAFIDAFVLFIEAFSAMKEKDSVEDKVAFEEHEAFAARFVVNNKFSVSLLFSLVVYPNMYSSLLRTYFSILLTSMLIRLRLTGNCLWYSSVMKAVVRVLFLLIGLRNEENISIETSSCFSTLLVALHKVYNCYILSIAWNPI